MHGVEVEKAACMNGVERKGIQTEHWCALYSDAQGNESVVYNTASVTWCVIIARAGNLEVGKIEKSPLGGVIEYYNQEH